MDANITRSEQVIDAFKRHKLATSIYSQIHRVIEGFEENAKIDRQFAEVGIMVALIVTGLAVYLSRVF